MKKIVLLCLVLISVADCYVFSQTAYDKHPDTSGDGWVKLFNDSLTNAIYTKEVWSFTWRG